MNDVSFGHLVKRLRRSLDLTQRDLARQIGYSVVTVRKVESDERRPSRELAERLAQSLNVDPADRQSFLTLARLLPADEPDAGRADARGRPGASPLANLHGLPPGIPASRQDRSPSPPTAPVAPATQPGYAPPGYAQPGYAQAGYAQPGYTQPGVDPGSPVPTNLATPLTRLIGRQAEDAAIRALLAREEVRLVTLVGPPGIGKSRLSVQVATELLPAFPHGVFTVALAPISDPALVAPTIAKTLGVKESAAQPLLECLVDYLRGRRLLLVLDNFEHMLVAASEIAQILTACPTLKVLTTSRQPLHLRGEHLYSVPALELPERITDVTVTTAPRYPAIELFVERAQAADHSFALTDGNAEDVAAICETLEGLPLAIELVAARVMLLAPQALLNRLDSRLTLLTGGPRDLPERQQTLRNTIDWSYQLLDEAEQALFARLAVFIGGCRLEAAEQVANADGDLPASVLDSLAALTDKHLLRQEQRDDGERYSVFFETIREFALERLVERGEVGVTRERYARFYLDLAEKAPERLAGSEQEAWLDRLDAEHNNLRAVMEYHVHRCDAAAALRMVAALWRFWHVRNHQTEGSRWIARSLTLTGAHDPRHRAQALIGAGWIASDQSNPARARSCFAESLELYRSIDDRRGIAEALHGVGGQVQASGDDTGAVDLFAESLDLYRQFDDREGIAWSLDHLGYAALYLDDPDGAMALFAESSEIFRELQHTWGSAISLHHQGLTLQARGEYELARARLREGLSCFEEIGNSWGVAQSFYHLGHVALSAGDPQQAEAYLRRSLELDQTEEDRSGMIRSLTGLGSAAVALRQIERATGLFGAVEALAKTTALRLTPQESTIHERDVAAVRARLGEQRFAAAWDAGHMMTLSEAAAYALAPPQLDEDDTDAPTT